MTVSQIKAPAAKAPAKAAKAKPAAAPELGVVASVTEQAPAIIPATSNRTLGNAMDVDAIAKELAAFIKTMKLTTTVQGKEHVNVEGWQYAGSRLGIVPIVENLINVGDEGEVKYQSKVTLFDVRAGITVGAGFAICSNKEPGRKNYQEFAIASMAQTRAVGKAFRTCIAWMIRAAGYEATPSEEMEYNGATPAPEQAAPIIYATASQKEEIIRLLNYDCITEDENKKMLLNINRLDEERATQAIEKLRKAIKERTEQA